MEFTGILLLSAALSIDAFNIGISCGIGGVRISLRARAVIFAVSAAVTGAAVSAGELLQGAVPEFAGKLLGAFLLIALGAYMSVGAIKGLLKSKQHNCASDYADNDNRRGVRPADGGTSGGKPDDDTSGGNDPDSGTSDCATSDSGDHNGNDHGGCHGGTVHGEGMISGAVRMLSDASSCDSDSSKNIDVREAVMIGTALSADSFAAGLGAGICTGAAFLIPLLCGAFQMIFLWCGEFAGRSVRRIRRIRQEAFGIAAGSVLIAAALIRLIV